VSRESGFELLVEHVERVELDGDDAVVVFDVEGEEHEVRVDVADTVADMRGSLTDDDADLVDLAAVPVIGGIALKLVGLLLRLGKL
jgi:hypothetical protein